MNAVSDNAASGRRSGFSEVPGVATRSMRRAGAAVLAAWLWLGAGAAGAADVNHIAVADYRLQIACEGVGEPTVVMDAGLGGSSLEWVFVTERLREVTRVCVYDRAGYGGSDTGPLPRTSSRIANELYLLLESAVVSPPFVLVGHSFGGYNMQVFARRYPYLTAGLVLVDASHPDQVERFLAPPLRMITAPSSRHGIVQFRDPPPPHALLPSSTRLRLMRRAGRWKTRRTVASELLSFRDSALEVARAKPLADLPLVVVTRGRRDGADNERRRLVERLWMELQSELASESRVSAHIVARASGHHVHIEQPDVVAFAVALLVDRHRAAAGGGDPGDADWAHDRIGLDDAVWLRDTLSLHPTRVVARAAGCVVDGTCEAGENGAP